MRQCVETLQEEPKLKSKFEHGCNNRLVDT